MIMIKLTIFVIGAPFGTEWDGSPYFIRISTGDIYVCTYGKTYLHGNYGHPATDACYKNILSMLDFGIDGNGSGRL